MFKKYHLNRKLFETLLAQKGYSGVSEFAQWASIHRNTLNGYLYGKKSVFSQTLEKLSQLLQIDPLELIEEKGTEAMHIPIPLKKTLLFLSKSFEHCAFVLIGSRAKESARPFSDWDIGVTGGHNELNSNIYLQLKDLIEDLVRDFPYSVDLVNLDQKPRWFLEEMDYQPKFLWGNTNAYSYFMGKLHEIRKNQAA